jgi:formylglycine-generating enzyme required for sulfatase activity
MRNFLVIAAILFVAAVASSNRVDAQAPRTSDDPLRHGHALLIGNSHYVDRDWPALADITLQLTQLAKGLKDHFDTVEVVQDLKTDELRNKVYDFVRKNGNEASARLFIYYAGHGYTEVIRNENRGYITGIDTPSIDGTTRAYDAARLKAIAMLEIRVPLQLAPAGHILFVFDSCFAGTISTNRGDPSPRMLTPDVVNRIVEKPARDFITAGGANEPVPAHSPIPGFFLAALNGDGEADRYRLGIISAVDIARYLRSHVLNLPGSNFTPQYGRLPEPEFTEGEFLFRVSNSVNTVDHSAEAWTAVKDTTSIAILERFRTLYPSSIYAPFAEARIEELKKLQIAIAPPPVPPAVPPRPAPVVPAVVAPPVVPPAASGPCGGGAVAVSLASRCAAPLSAAEESALKPKDRFKECDNCPEMVVVPSASFTMGSPDSEKDRYKDEGPPHRVTIAKPFAVGKFHITVDQFAAFVTETGYDAGSKCWTFEDGKGEERSSRSWRNPGFTQGGSHPAVCLNWNDAKAYVAWLARKTGKTYRLLTEAEWEYAARVRIEPGAYPRYSFGNDEKDLCRYGNGADQTAKSSIAGAKDWAVAPCSDGYAYTSPVGSFAANGFALYDMQGNAWQWTEDCYHDSYAGAPSDGSAWTTGDCGSRVVRGGSWVASPQVLRSANRNGGTTGDPVSSLGFRVARTLTP